MPGNYRINDPKIGVFLTVSTLSFGIPTMKAFLKTGRTFDFAVSFILLFSSFMYHMSESFHTNKLFLKELEWHRLDNIGVLAAISATNIYLCDFESKLVSELLNWFSFFVILILQLKGPWLIKFTLVPLCVFFALPVCKHLSVWFYRRVNKILSNKKNEGDSIKKQQEQPSGQIFTLR